MQDQKPVRYSINKIAGISAIILAVGSGGAWWALHSLSSPTSAPVTTTSQQTLKTKAVQPSGERKIEIYWLKDTGKNMVVVPSKITLKTGEKPDKILTTAFNQLLAGSTNPPLTSTIPPGTKLRSINIKKDGIHLDLSQEFTNGGGSTSMTGRLAQVLYTATSLNPEAQVWINVEGKKLDVLGGEGLELDQPLTRKNFEVNFPM